MLLHWMQTRWMTVLTTAPGCRGLGETNDGGTTAFSGLLSVDMGGF